MDQVYFLALIVQLREMDMGVSEALGDEVAGIRKYRRKMYLLISGEMEERWAANIERNKRRFINGVKCVQELKDRDHRTFHSHTFFQENIHPGRCILPRGERRRPGYDPSYEINQIIGQKFDTPNIYLGGHRLLVQSKGYIHRRKEVKVDGGLVMWRGVFAQGLNDRIYEIMDELGFTDKERWLCSYGPDEKKLEQWKRVYNYLLEKDQ